MQLAPCNDCSGQVLAGQFDPITVPLVDPEGFPIFESDGSVLKATMQLPRHAIPGIATPSRFDPTALVPVGCAHGLAHHPDPIADAYGRRRGGRSFIRSKYTTDPFPGRDCPECRHEPRPADLVVAADGSPVGPLVADCTCPQHAPQA